MLLMTSPINDFMLVQQPATSGLDLLTFSKNGS